MPKKKLAQTYTPDTPTSSREVTLNLWAALGIVGAAVLTSVVGTAFTFASIANTDHFLLKSTVDAVEEIRNQYVTREQFSELREDVKYIRSRLDQGKQ